MPDLSKDAVNECEIKRYKDGQIKSTLDHITVEEPLEIRLSYNAAHRVYRTMSLAVTMRTPGDDQSLAKGFLFTEGMTNSHSDIRDVAIVEDNIVLVTLKEDVSFDADLHRRNFYTTSSCGVCGKASIESIHSDTVHLPWKSKIVVTPEVILSLSAKLESVQSGFSETGGVHACALFDDGGKLISINEDVGRHNAMDKLIGSQDRFPLHDLIVLVSGRASFELVQKASKAGIGMMVAIGAPSSLAIELAEEQGMTLVGFTKKDKFNIYTGFERISEKHI